MLSTISGIMQSYVSKMDICWSNSAIVSTANSCAR